MNENLAQLLENAQKGYYEYVGKKFNTIVENGDLQSIKTNIEFFGKMLDALNEVLKNGDKNSKLINEIGEKLARGTGLKYLPSDFKKKGGYLRSIELSKEYDLYRQNYCGCEFSKQK